MDAAPQLTSSDGEDHRRSAPSKVGLRETSDTAALPSTKPPPRPSILSACMHDGGTEEHSLFPTSCCMKPAARSQQQGKQQDPQQRPILHKRTAVVPQIYGGVMETQIYPKTDKESVFVW